MKHVKNVTVAKADIGADIASWFESLWEQISSFFKGE